jgi:hypothetical protein
VQVLGGGVRPGLYNLEGGKELRATNGDDRVDHFVLHEVQQGVEVTPTVQPNGLANEGPQKANPLGR